MGSSAASAASAARVARVAETAPPARIVERSADRVATIRVVEPAAEPVQGAPPRVPGSPVAPMLDAGLDQLSVRMFFSRLLAATPEGLTIDFARWQAATVERFFLAITSPGLIRRREAPTTGDERLTLPTAFDGFEWD